MLVPYQYLQQAPTDYTLFLPWQKAYGALQHHTVTQTLSISNNTSMCWAVQCLSHVPGQMPHFVTQLTMVMTKVTANADQEGISGKKLSLANDNWKTLEESMVNQILFCAYHCKNLTVSCLPLLKVQMQKMWRKNSCLQHQHQFLFMSMEIQLRLFHHIDYGNHSGVHKKILTSAFWCIKREKSKSPRPLLL